MKNVEKLVWLRRLLLIKTAFCFFVWGLPALLGTAGFLAVFGLQMPADPIFLRLLGGVVVAVGVVYWFGFQDPARNIAIVKFGIVDNVIATTVLLVFGFTGGLKSWFLWVSVVFTLVFALGFLVLLPAAARAARLSSIHPRLGSMRPR